MDDLAGESGYPRFDGATQRPHSLERHFGAAQTIRCESAPVIRVRPWAAVYANPAYANTFGSQAGLVAASRGEDQVEGCRPGS